MLDKILTTLPMLIFINDKFSSQIYIKELNLSIGYFFVFLPFFCIINDLHFKKTYVIIALAYEIIN